MNMSGKIPFTIITGMILVQVALAPLLEASTISDKYGLPEVLGMKYEDACARLEKAGFRCQKKPTNLETTDINQAGKVAGFEGNFPAPAPKGSTVILTLYAYRGTVKESIVPNVIGLNYEQAKQDLTKYKFVADIHDVVVNKPSLSKGIIMKQQYPAGTKLSEGTRIQLEGQIYKLMPNVKAPDARNLSKEEARKKLVSVGINVMSTQLRTTTQKEKDGMVLDQNPAPGSLVLQGYPVIIIVGKYEAGAIEAYCNYIPIQCIGRCKTCRGSSLEG
jgi:beta-lactam-binding protein with PASTA domain